MELFSVGTLETAQGNESSFSQDTRFSASSLPLGEPSGSRLIEVLHFVGNLSGPFVHVPKITFVYRLEKPDRLFNIGHTLLQSSR